MATSNLRLKNLISTRQHFVQDFYKYNKMTFGLCKAPVTFQRLMDQVIYDLNNKICAIYLDDIFIWISSLDKHLERLDAVFKRLVEARLKLKPSKCIFSNTKLVILDMQYHPMELKQIHQRLIQSHLGNTKECR